MPLFRKKGPDSDVRVSFSNFNNINLAKIGNFEAFDELYIHIHENTPVVPLSDMLKERLITAKINYCVLPQSFLLQICVLNIDNLIMATHNI